IKDGYMVTLYEDSGLTGNTISFFGPAEVDDLSKFKMEGGNSWSNAASSIYIEKYSGGGSSPDEGHGGGGSGGR
ncbi:MAG: hypothetical protein J7L45_00985, partial [Candidatus Aenigmarchaeota archaeon]|nr:hypothetical protein [Candidatus Aenigmarchaeota archaeon]